MQVGLTSSSLATGGAHSGIVVNRGAHSGGAAKTPGDGE